MAERSHLCVGIDPHPASLAAWGLPDTAVGLEVFSLRLLEAALAGGAAAVKPQSALFERHGSGGIGVLEAVLRTAAQRSILTILDVKRGDIGSTMAAYAQAYLSDAAPLAADAITVNPYLGFGSLKPCVELAAETGRGLFVLALTSNPEAASVQRAAAVGAADRLSVGEAVIQAVIEANKASVPTGRDSSGSHGVWGSLGVVIGATIGPLSGPGKELLAQFNGPILAPGVGAQGAGPPELRAVFGAAQGRVLVTVSRSIAAAGPDTPALEGAVAQATAEMAFLER
jgi:orotidine-5'-phosphate decarboxylase